MKLLCSGNKSLEGDRNVAFCVRQSQRMCTVQYGTLDKFHINSILVQTVPGSIGDFITNLLLEKMPGQIVDLRQQFKAS